jgi:hypothetical protein
LSVVLPLRAVAVAATLFLAPPATAGGGDADWREAVQLPGFGAVEIVVRADMQASPPSASMVLEDATGAVVYRFPSLPGTDDYAYFDIQDLALADIDGDGRDDIIVIVEAMTGIGPTGAVPFRQAAIHLRATDGFVRADALEETLNTPPGYDTWHDMESLLRALAASR